MATGSNDAAKLRCFRSFSVNMEWLRIVAPSEIYYLLLCELDRFTEKFVADLIVFEPFNFRACFAHGFLLFVPFKFVTASLCLADLTLTTIIDVTAT